jgi:hypothetical protein
VSPVAFRTVGELGCVFSGLFTCYKFVQPSRSLRLVLTKVEYLVGGDGGGVSDGAATDVVFEGGAAGPGGSKIMFFWFRVGCAGVESCSEKYVGGLAGEAGGVMDGGEVFEVVGGETGFFGEFCSGKVNGGSGVAVGPGSLGKFEGALPDGIPELFNEVEAVIFGGDDHCEVCFINDAVETSSTVTSLNTVLA